MSSYVLVTVLGLCWGSFLNVVTYRLVRGQDFIFQRSRCPSCHHILAWYDIIPLVSWLLLRGNCRYCTAKISYTYPLFEIITASLFLGVWFTYGPHYFPAYAIFVSALIIALRVDTEHMIIPTITTWYVIPCALIASAGGRLPINLFESALGMIFGYALLWSVKRTYWLIKHQEGLGDGDLDLLAMIGSFTGIIGAWITLVMASLLGTIAVCTLFFFRPPQQRSWLQTKIPLGLFLALGACIYIFLTNKLTSLFLGV